MSEPRFTTLTPETMTADQKRVADAIQAGPRGAGQRGRQRLHRALAGDVAMSFAQLDRASGQPVEKRRRPRI